MRGNISVLEAAKLMGKSEMFVRIGLQRGSLPIGNAVKTSSKYSYYISPKLFEEYTGIKVDEPICTNQETQDKIE